jgi:hypothetical protein
MQLLESKEMETIIWSVTVSLAIILIFVSFSEAISEKSYSNGSLEQNCGKISLSSNIVQNVPVKAGAYAAIFFLNWTNNQSKLGLELTAPDGTRYDRESDSIAYSEGETFDYFLLQNPAKGIWIAKIFPMHLRDSQEDYCLLIDESISEDVLGKAKFNGIFSDEGLDSDFDDIYDAISINVGIDVYKAGIYTITGSLRDINGSEIRASNQAYLDIGAQDIRLDFSGSNSAGKRRVGNLTLYDGTGYALDHIENEYMTKAYNKIEQGPPAAKFSGNYSDQGIDIDSDGFYDLLIIYVGMHVHNPGEFVLTGTLYGQKGDEIAWSIDQRQLPAGLQQMQLDFDGKVIGKHGAGGSYQLKNLILASNNWSMSDLASEAYNTSSYNASQFAASV